MKKIKNASLTWKIVFGLALLFGCQVEAVVGFEFVGVGVEVVVGRRELLGELVPLSP